MAGESKTEKATPKKRRDERKKGNVMMSKDVVAVATLIGSLVMFRVMGNVISEQAENMFRTCFGFISSTAPADMPGIVVTQHMPEGFTKMYAERLNRICKLEVKEAANGDRVRRGLVLIAPGGPLQMRVEKDLKGYYVSCQPGEKVNGHRPSVDVLFSSVAKKVGRNAVGIIMTGMGRDGASGLLEMRNAGAFTIGQDKEACVVYGMPMVAYDIGGVCIQASCTNISNVLLNQLRKM